MWIFSRNTLVCTAWAYPHRSHPSVATNTNQRISKEDQSDRTASRIKRETKRIYQICSNFISSKVERERWKDASPSISAAAALATGCSGRQWRKPPRLVQCWVCSKSQFDQEKWERGGQMHPGNVFQQFCRLLGLQVGRCSCIAQICNRFDST